MLGGGLSIWFTCHRYKGWCHHFASHRDGSSTSSSLFAVRLVTLQEKERSLVGQLIPKTIAFSRLWRNRGSEGLQDQGPRGLSGWVSAAYT